MSICILCAQAQSSHTGSHIFMKLESDCKRCSRSFKADRAQSRPLTALIEYLIVLSKYFGLHQFSLLGHSQHLGGPEPFLACP